jgi:hypothetical protein
VAEHLPEAFADRLIDILVDTAPIVIFSAAFPGQTGVNHINEQPPWYWREKFHRLNYVEIDFLRPLIWGDGKVAWWYRQNITSYVCNTNLKENKKLKNLYNKFKGQNQKHRLTAVSEFLLQKLLSQSKQRTRASGSLWGFFKGLR